MNCKAITNALANTQHGTWPSRFCAKKTLSSSVEGKWIKLTEAGQQHTARTGVCDEGNGKTIRTLAESGVWETVVAANGLLLSQQLESDSDGQ